MTRTYKVKGKDEFGVELERTGDLVRLRTHTPGWPFPAERTLPRDALVWICGDPEPPAPSPQEPTEEEGTTMNEICLTVEEIVDITGRVRPAAQARHLKRMLGLDCQRRADGSLLVGREVAMRAITARAKATGDAQGVPVQKEPGGEASNGLNWSKRA